MYGNIRNYFTNSISWFDVRGIYVVENWRELNYRTVYEEPGIQYSLLADPIPILNSR